MLNYNDYIFEQKLNFIFSDVNEGMNWISDNEVEWNVIEEKIPKTNTRFWTIIDSLDKKSKFLIGTLLNKSIKLLNERTEITKEQAKKLLNKIIEKLDHFIKNVNLKKKLIYLSVFLIVTTTSLSMMDIINAESVNIDNSIENVITTDISKIDNKTTKNISTVDTVNIKSKLKPSTDYLEKLAFKESSGHWNKVRYVTVKRNGKKIKKPVYVGKYQFGNLAFKDIGSNIRVNDFVKDPTIWSSEQQDKDLAILLKNNKHYLRKRISFKGYEHYIGKTINGIEMTESGILTAAHLVGNKGVKTFLKTNGEKDPEDGNGTKCSHYMSEFANYQLPI